MTVQRWKCTSYCLCGSRKGHFEKSDDDGVWVRYEAAHALEQEIERLKSALQKIAAYDPGKFRPLEDEIAIWKLATEALSACSCEPQSAEHGAKPHK